MQNSRKSLEEEEVHDVSYNEDEEEAEMKRIQEQSAEEEEENKEIRNFISTMRNGDIENLHQSLRGTMREEELKRAV